MNELGTKDDLDDKTPFKIEEEGDVLKDPEIDNELDVSKWEQDPVKFVAIETTTTFMIIVTNYWRPLECAKEDSVICELELLDRLLTRISSAIVILED